MLHQSVIDAWRKFSEPLEGRVAGMYLDILGLVTCAVGILIDPVHMAIALPWKRDADNEPASTDEIRTAWSLLKTHQEYSRRSTASARALTKLHLDDADIDAIVGRKLEQNAAFVTQHYFPAFDTFPADAQLALMSMAWAVGPAFPGKFPSLRVAVEDGNWVGAREHCTIREVGNPGVVPRNRANRVCFANAAIVVAESLALDILRWPNVAQADVPASDQTSPHRALIVESLEDARLHALEVSRLEGHREMLSDPSDEPTNPVGFKREGIA